MTPLPRVSAFRPSLPVRTMVKADMFCSSVAAASVLAKVERDAMMVALAVEVPEYAWGAGTRYSAPSSICGIEVRRPERSITSIQAAARSWAADTDRLGERARCS